MKKRAFGFLVVLLSLVCALMVSASAETVTYAVTGGNIYFDTEAGTVTGCDNSVTEAVIPAEIGGVSVTCIGDWAFSYCYNLTDVSIPNSVTMFGRQHGEYAGVHHF